MDRFDKAIDRFSLELEKMRHDHEFLFGRVRQLESESAKQVDLLDLRSRVEMLECVVQDSPEPDNPKLKALFGKRFPDPDAPKASPALQYDATAWPAPLHGMTAEGKVILWTPSRSLTCEVGLLTEGKRYRVTVEEV